MIENPIAMSFGCAKKKLDEYTFTENFYILIKELLENNVFIFCYIF